MSRYEEMRLNPENWKFGVVYVCAEDPRLVVRQWLRVGWTWNFAHPQVYPLILVAVVFFLAPPGILWWLGHQSFLALSLGALFGLGVIMLVASRMAKDPELKSG